MICWYFLLAIGGLVSKSARVYSFTFISLLLMVVISLSLVVNHNRAVQSWDEKELLSLARAMSLQYNVDFNVGREEIGYIGQVQYLQMHGAYLPPDNPLNTDAQVFVYRVYGDWQKILNYSTGETGRRSVFEIAINSETGALLLTTSYDDPSRVPNLIQAARASVHVPAPFPTGIPEE
jgi:hypothetical protein